VARHRHPTGLRYVLSDHALDLIRSNPDGTYWPDCALQHCSAFYYGGDGPSPQRKITILSASPSVGSWADIAIDFGNARPNLSSLSALVVDATTLRFTFSASWFSCGQPFDFNLTRY
jgi:hypothetical protein